MAAVLSINISIGGIPKLPVETCRITLDGLDGDGCNHSKHVNPNRAISLIDNEILQQLEAEGYDVCPGAVGENITIENLDVQSLEPHDRLSFSGGVVIELVEPRKPCFVLDTISPQLKTDIVGRCGYLARVITQGNLCAGESISITKNSSS